MIEELDKPIQKTDLKLVEFRMSNSKDFKVLSKILDLDIYEDFKNSDLSGELYVDTDFSDYNFYGSVINDSIFEKCTFSHTNLVNCDLNKSIFKQCTFLETDLSKSKFNDVSFIDCEFEESNISNTIIDHCKMDNTVIKRANLTNSEIVSCLFAHTKIYYPIVLNSLFKKNKGIHKNLLKNLKNYGAMLERNTPYEEKLVV